MSQLSHISVCLSYACSFPYLHKVLYIPEIYPLVFIWQLIVHAV